MRLPFHLPYRQNPHLLDQCGIFLELDAQFFQDDREIALQVGLRQFVECYNGNTLVSFTKSQHHAPQSNEHPRSGCRTVLQVLRIRISHAALGDESQTARLFSCCWCCASYLLSSLPSLCFLCVLVAAVPVVAAAVVITVAVVAVKLCDRCCCC